MKNLYDGVHMYGSSGKKAYTKSILNILREAELVRNNPPSYFRKYHNMTRIDISDKI